MHLTSPPVTLENSSLLFQTNSHFQPLAETSKPSTSMSPNASSAFPLFQTQPSVNKNHHELDTHTDPTDPDVILCNSQKKVKTQEWKNDMLGDLDEASTFLPQPLITCGKNVLSPSQNVVPSTDTEEFSRNPRLEKDLKENLATSKSNDNIFKVPPEKEIINLEDDSDAEVDINALTNDFLDQLVVVDEVTLDVQRARDQVEKQIKQASLRNLIAQAEVQRQQQMNPYQMAWLAAQTGQLPQRNTIYPEAYAAQMLGLQLGGLNPALVPMMVQNMKIAQAAQLARQQAQFQFQPNGFQPTSVLGKRENPYDNSVETRREEFVRNEINEILRAKQGNLIVIDDDERAFKKTKIFRIERTERKKVIKKPIFKIITQKPKPYIKPNISKKSIPFRDENSLKNLPKKLNRSDSEVDPESSVASGERFQEGTINLVKALEAFKKQNDLESEQESSVNMKDTKGSKKRGSKGSPTESTSKRKESKNFDEDENYVIKLHVEEGDEDISETPVGDKHQAKVGAFVKGGAKKRIVKNTWNPELVKEEEIKEYFKEIETRFEKPIVNQAVALKAYRESGMNLDKVINLLETSKVWHRDFFEIRQKVLRHRMLQYEMYL